jgi:hypothetical protein
VKAKNSKSEATRKKQPKRHFSGKTPSGFDAPKAATNEQKTYSPNRIQVLVFLPQNAPPRDLGPAKKIDRKNARDYFSWPSVGIPIKKTSEKREDK